MKYRIERRDTSLYYVPHKFKFGNSTVEIRVLTVRVMYSVPDIWNESKSLQLM